MKRKIPQDTKYFKYYNANPKNKVTADCTVRALSTSLNEPWEFIYDELTKLGKKCAKMPDDSSVINKYLISRGFVKQKEPRDIFNRKIRAKDFLEENPNLTAVAYLGSHHIASIKDGVVYDIWNSSNEIIHTYYVKSFA